MILGHQFPRAPDSVVFKLWSSAHCADSTVRTLPSPRGQSMGTDALYPAPGPVLIQVSCQSPVGTSCNVACTHLLTSLIFLNEKPGYFGEEVLEFFLLADFIPQPTGKLRLCV